MGQGPLVTGRGFAELMPGLAPNYRAGGRSGSTLGWTARPRIFFADPVGVRTKADYRLQILPAKSRPRPPSGLSSCGSDAARATLRGAPPAPPTPELRAPPAAGPSQASVPESVPSGSTRLLLFPGAARAQGAARANRPKTSCTSLVQDEKQTLTSVMYRSRPRRPEGARFPFVVMPTQMPPRSAL